VAGHSLGCLSALAVAQRRRVCQRSVTIYKAGDKCAIGQMIESTAAKAPLPHGRNAFATMRSK
jgi:malonyl CoA-acyl carrier protein transacylase